MALSRVVSARPVLRVKGERHWNARAHEVAARALLRALPLAGPACRRAAAVLTDRRE